MSAPALEEAVPIERIFSADGPRPSLRSFFAKLWQSRDLTAALVQAELKVSVRGAALHYLWWVLDPLLLMLVYALILSNILDRGPQHTLLYLFSGLLPWRTFAGTLQHATLILRNSQAILARAAFPRAVMPLTITLTQIIYMLAGLPLLLILILFEGLQPGLRILILPLIITAQLILTFGLACLLSILGARYRDTTHLVGHALHLAFLASPILYEMDRVPANWQILWKLNPFVPILSLYRAALMNHPWPGILDALPGSFVAFAIVTTGCLVFARSERELCKIL